MTVNVQTKVIWQADAFNARLKGAFRPAAFDFRRAAQAAAARSSRRVARSINVRFVTKSIGAGNEATVGSSHPLAHLFEGGVAPHSIGVREFAGRGRRRSATGHKALKFTGGDGGFARGTVPHPGMRARPFLHPLLPTWPVIYRRRATAAIGSGIRGVGSLLGGLGV